MNISNSREVSQMILQFSCSNHKSIKEKVTFSAIASSDNTFEETLKSFGNMRVLRSAVIYGANGSINALNIFQGYRSNAIVLRENDQTMRQTAQIYKETNQLEGAIVLKNVPNEAYAGCLPSEEGTEWYLSYYGLPENTELVFR